MNTILAAPPVGASLIEVTLYKMRRAIVCCDLAPGEKLKIDALSKSYGISSSPIREALNRLAQEGIVLATDNKGFRVSPISIDDFHEISRVRILLESEALSDAITMGDDAWEGNVLSSFHQLDSVEKRLSKGAIALDDDWAKRHKAFHFALFSASSSLLLLNLINSMFDRAERYRRYSALHRQSSRHKSNEHHELMSAALQRNGTKAVALLQAHINGTCESITKALAIQIAGTKQGNTQ